MLVSPVTYIERELIFQCLLFCYPQSSTQQYIIYCQDTCWLFCFVAVDLILLDHSLSSPTDMCHNSFLNTLCSDLMFTAPVPQAANEAKAIAGISNALNRQPTNPAMMDLLQQRVFVYCRQIGGPNGVEKLKDGLYFFILTTTTTTTATSSINLLCHYDSFVQTTFGLLTESTEDQLGCCIGQQPL